MISFLLAEGRRQWQSVHVRDTHRVVTIISNNMLIQLRYQGAAGLRSLRQ